MGGPITHTAETSKAFIDFRRSELRAGPGALITWPAEEFRRDGPGTCRRPAAAGHSFRAAVAWAIFVDGANSAVLGAG